MKLKKKCQDSMIGWLEKKYPGVRDIVNLLDNIRERVDKQYIRGLSEVEEIAEKEQSKEPHQTDGPAAAEKADVEGDESAQKLASNEEKEAEYCDGG